MNRVTKYNNQLNSVPMRQWSAEEQNFFFAIITEARERGQKKLIFEEDQLKELASYSDKHNQRFIKTINNLVSKLDQMRYFEPRENGYKLMTLFQEFDVSWQENEKGEEKLKIELIISERFEYIVNKLNTEFTRFELAQFTNIRSTYAKECFKKFKQWRTVGRRVFKADAFREELAIPKSYRATDINKNVISPILDELAAYFENLKLETKRAKTKGKPIEAYIFTWKPEKSDKWIENKYSTKSVSGKFKNSKLNKTRKEDYHSWKRNVDEMNSKEKSKSSREVQERLDQIREMEKILEQQMEN